jgi:hypothetical protein
VAKLLTIQSLSCTDPEDWIVGDEVRLEVRVDNALQDTIRGVITSPLPDERLPHQRAVLSGQGLDLDGQRPILDGLRWRSSKDGELGKGQVLEAELSTGKHVIALHLGDADVPLAEVTVQVAAPKKPKPAKPRKPR